METLPSSDELDRILLENGMSAYQQELAASWDTEDEDMNDALSIMRKVSKLKFIEEYHVNGDLEEITFPQWVLDLRKFFAGKYGTDKGWVVFVKVHAKFVKLAVVQNDLVSAPKSYLHLVR